ncbi:MAG: isochorismatase family cysteine hydrolase [Candidatus Woesearchaeota archaeon]
MKPSTALILVDLEQEWLTQGSDYYAKDLTKTIPKINQLIDDCRAKGYKIVFIRHVEEGSKDIFAEGMKRSEIIKELHRKPSDTVMTKYKISSFYKTILEKELKGIKKIIISGILTNLCVRSLAQDAYDREFEITIISDCCVAFDQKTHEFTLQDLKKTREEIEIMKIREFLEK